VKVVGVFTDLDAPLDKINVHVRGSFIILMQTSGASLILAHANPFTLLVAQSATENLFWGDGDSIGKYIFSNNKINHMHFLCFLLRFNRNKNV
jgi:alpha-glucosidase (family GH31 glycosyl hydrolase)